MKKIIYFITIICLFVTSVSNVLAYDMLLTGDDNIDKNITIKLAIEDYKEYEGFYGITATLKYDDTKLELTKISGDNNFELTYGAAAKKIVLYSPRGTKELVPVMTMQFKNIALSPEEETIISLEDITASDSKQNIEVANVSKTIKALNAGNNTSDTNLTSLKINGKPLEIKDGELTYDIVVSNDTESIKVTAKSKNKKNTINGTGKYELEEGNNEIKIDVTDEDGETRTYTINVNREGSDFDQESDELFLKSNEKYGWNNLYFIPIIIIIIIVGLIIKKKGIR